MREAGAMPETATLRDQVTARALATPISQGERSCCRALTAISLTTVTDRHTHTHTHTHIHAYVNTRKTFGKPISPV